MYETEDRKTLQGRGRTDTGLCHSLQYSFHLLGEDRLTLETRECMIDESLTFFAVLGTSRRGTADSQIHSSSSSAAYPVPNQQLVFEPAQTARAIMSGISRKDHTISRGVSVVIPFQLSDSGSIQFLVVSSRRHIGQCVFPKVALSLESC